MTLHSAMILLLLLLFLFVYYKIINIITYESFSEKNNIKLSKDNTEIFVINLKSNKDRYYSFVNQFMNTDMKHYKLNRIDAVNGRMISDHELKVLLSDEGYKDLIDSEKRGYRIKHHQMTRGSVGCYLSHMKTYKQFLESNKEYAIIFEDDVHIKKLNYINSIDNIIKEIPNDWDIILLGCICFVCHKYKSYYDTRKFILLHSYVINRNSAGKIYNLLDSSRINKQIDSEFSDLLQSNKIKIYCIRNNLSVQNNNDFATTIQMPIKYVDGVNPFS